ncbi:MAG: hypothetical protein AB1631_01075 [Acidobacteriota bacterium]
MIEIERDEDGKKSVSRNISHPERRITQAVAQIVYIDLKKEAVFRVPPLGGGLRITNIPPEGGTLNVFFLNPMDELGAIEGRWLLRVF